MQNSDRLPKLVAFDLDFTLWGLYIDQYSGPIICPENKFNLVYDRDSYPISFYPDVPEILHMLKKLPLIIAACSRTSAIELAHQVLSSLHVPPSTTNPDDVTRTATSFFDQKEIYPGSKTQHFNQLHTKTGIAYEDMLFFDDESRNKEVEKLGVTFILVQQGMNNAAFNRGLEEWRRRHPPPPFNLEVETEEAIDSKAN